MGGACHKSFVEINGGKYWVGSHGVYRVTYRRRHPMSGPRNDEFVSYPFVSLLYFSQMRCSEISKLIISSKIGVLNLFCGLAWSYHAMRALSTNISE